MAKYCGNCGAQMQDTDRVCGNCGTPFDMGPEPAQMEKNFNPAPVNNGMPVAGNQTTGPKNNKRMIAIAAIAAGAVAVLAAVITVVCIIIGSLTGPGATVNKVVDAIKNSDYEAYSALMSDAYREQLRIQRGSGYEEAEEQALEYALRTLEDLVGGEIQSLNCEIVEINEFNQRKLKDYKESLEDNYGIYADEIEGVASVDLRIVVTGEEGNKRTHKGHDIILIKEHGAWKMGSSL